MVPRADIDAVPESISLTDLMLLFKESAHSRMPVYRESLDDAYGMVHIRDLMGHIVEAATTVMGPAKGQGAEGLGLSLTQVDLSRTLADTPGLVRDILTIPQWIPVTDLLAQMQQKRIQIALVIDEYGGVDGLLSLEDIVEVVVGDIEDEHDVAEAPGVIAAGADAWVVDGQTLLDELAEAISPIFGATSLTDEVDTLAGLVVMLAGRVPAVGERVTSPDEVPGFAFEVMEADDLRVIKAKVTRATAPAEEAGAIGAAK
jgi:CBS domain containing-hemolysin-like protein